MPKLTKSDIHGRTLEYLDLPKKDRGCYVDELLGRELQHAESDPLPDGTPRLRRLDKPVHTLALTVGESFEPLLQVVCVLNPKRVVLILNNLYEGGSGLAHGATLKKWMMKLAQAPDLPADMQKPQLQDSEFDLAELDADTPTDVFRALQALLQKADAQPPNGYTNAVDITGAKKSMVVGAFLYAAHSSLPITYVDFDKYDPEKGRTFGYSCKIGRIADPYAAFHLRDWEHVRRLYDKYSFRGARELIGVAATGAQPGAGILGAMSRPQEAGLPPHTLYEKEDVEKAERLARVLRMYEAWDSGDFNAAADLASRLPVMELPSVIERFGKGKKWFSITGSTFSDIPPGFYGNEAGLKIYAHDELARIQRLIDCNEDNRSAFLRAAGLNEVLLTARLVRLITDRIDRETLDAVKDLKTPFASALFPVLLKEQGESVSSQKAGFTDVRLVQPIRLTSPMQRWWKSTRYFNCADDWKVFLEDRNKLAHRFMSVSRELAEDAICFVRANFEDFIGAPVSSLTTTVKALDWSEMCSFCKLDFLPPKLRD